MPETFHVEVCYETPCHWTPPPLPPSTTTDQQTFPRVEGHRSQVLNGNMPIPGEYGDHQNTHGHVKRAPAPEPDPQTDNRQGPPLPEPPHAHGNGEPVEIIEYNTMSDVDPEIQQLALERQQQTQAIQRSTRPASFIHHMDSRYILRPEAIESVFYMWRITGDPEWQEKGWRMWESIEQSTWTELAYSAITDVTDANSTKADSMERYPFYL